MSGLIKVWSVETGDEVWLFEVSDLEVCIDSLCIKLFFVNENDFS